jgi:serine/threonine protein kinase
MTSEEARLDELMTRWEESQRTGHTLSIGELCRECPELQYELTRRIEALGIEARDLRPGDSESDSAPPQRPAHPPSGLAVAGYEILGELGHGGMGVVYRAFDQKRKRVVALKTVRTLGPSALYRFKQEFRALADVTHPNLVSLYELVMDGRTWFFTMELVEGVNFLEHVRPSYDRGAARPPSTVPEQGAPERERAPAEETLPEVDPALRWVPLRAALKQLAAGVRALHEAGKLHRDIKPTNVLVTSSGRVVLLDFGLAAELEPSGQHHSSVPHILGTISYMAPEQAAGLPVFPASDWYSVGVMLYEALTGWLPFRGANEDVLLDKQLNEPRAPHELAPDVPPDLDELCVDLLRRKPEARPAGEEILRRLGSPLEELRTGFGARLSQVQHAALIGRERHLDILKEAFAEVSQGRTVLLWVHGGSGVGKSALVQHFLDGLVARNAAVVLSGRCYERESVPYKALDSLIDALSRYVGRLTGREAEALLPRDVLSLARVFPVFQRIPTVAIAPRRLWEVPDPQELRRRAFAALRELLGRLGDRRPLVLAIDDLQWGDADSAALLADLLQPPDPPVFLLVGSYRSEDAAVSPLLQALLGTREAGASAVDRRELAVEPLGAEEVEALVLGLLGRDEPADRASARAIAREADGNPFFVHELVHYLQAGEGIERRPPPGEGGGITLDRVLWERILRLPEEPRRLLQAVAVSGRPLGQENAFLAAGLDQGGQEALAVLRSNRLVRSTGPTEQGEIETYHDRVRETVVSHLAPEVLAEQHLHLALALERSGQADIGTTLAGRLAAAGEDALQPSGEADPETVAVHFQRANQLERAGEYFALAAAQAEGALAFEHAAKLYGLALELRPPAAEAVRALRTRLADALANAGRGFQAAQQYLAAAVGSDVKEALELRRRAAFQYLISGHIDAGLVELRAVLAGVGLKLPSSPRRALFALLWGRSLVRMRGLGFREASPDAIASDDMMRIDICDSASVGLGVVDPICGAAVQARTLLLSLRAGEPSRIARALAWEACHVATLGRPSRARAELLLQNGDALAERAGEPRVQATMALARGIVAYLQGRWRDSRAHCDRAEALFRERSAGVAWELDTAHTFALWSLAHMGGLAELARRRVVFLKEAQERGDLYAMTNLSTYIMAVFRLAADEPEEARTELSGAMERWSQKGFHIQHHNALLARLHIDLYRGDGAAAWGHISEQWPAYSSSLLLRVQQVRIDVNQLRARTALAAAATAPDPRKLLRRVDQIARQLEREGVPWASAHAGYLRAALAQARGDSAGARTAFARAGSLYEAADMTLYAAAMRRRLGEALGGEKGRALVSDADAAMTAQSVRNPARMTLMYAPIVQRA